MPLKLNFRMPAFPFLSATQNIFLNLAADQRAEGEGTIHTPPIESASLQMITIYTMIGHNQD